ncbi:BREX-2 system adenine-specific DNA-methyltransferase PglX [Mesorhizobium sp.]|uniref:BREX-2 system adenine-specific DNA-methyltransferase PglX n=1 Tax=Mesorhizobium sp. TaxID=1871066 RepID=UPI001200D4B9|nr:BREX-2 system adenine-specific DNA-methyltransferase PglX [Mesorhizobium sp.]TIL48219.1 MAG: BREX-2 system adenine-specific DNA-methyltransferase PglX [Mesorhizobium sp.]TIL85304.1 MAG: BREX-2 system adenine-specific DNA-methyltransferase PglX [Mesorhizobium sp.]
MVDARRLLADLKKLRKKLEEDLRRHHNGSPGRAAVEAEWREARETKRSADTFETFFGAAVDQAAVHWILALVFLRFLEDNLLLDRPLIAGPGERLEVSQLRQRDWFRTRPEDSDVEYLLAVFAEVAHLPGLAGLFDPAHNPLFQLPISGDGAIALFDFFRQRSPETGELLHDFTDSAWNTRFLGDLYQDLSEEARKRFALLQTPEFVESWILSRTLDPAIREFGHEQVRMIDPTCGSGHFLLGGFARILQEWRRHAPEMPPAAQAQRALDSVAGVDLNPFAVEIARFRLLVEALGAAGEARLAAAPDFRFQLATGDSLLHGQQFARQELGGTAEGFRRVLRHHYAAEDTATLDAVLGRQYHAVVGNPPYITPKDAAMRDAYREIYQSCYRAYALSAPFTERFFDLAQTGAPDRPSGFVGLIVANSFMKREFGSALIEEVLPHLDLTHVVDTSGAYIPGHGTPTVILFGRNQPPVASFVRAVLGIRGESAAPLNPAQGRVWSAIVRQVDLAGSQSEFVSVADVARSTFCKHPWSMGGGGAGDVKQQIEKSAKTTLGEVVTEIGFGAVTREDDAYLLPAQAALRHRVAPEFIKPMVEGEDVRDYRMISSSNAIWPYDAQTLKAKPSRAVTRLLWLLRTGLSSRVAYGQSQLERGLEWFEYSMFFRNRFLTPFAITFAFVATHNHFVLDRGGKLFNRSAPIIKLPAAASENDHLGLLGLLNSSAACFWIKQVCHNKGGQGINEGAKAEVWERFIEVTGTRLEQFPLPNERPIDIARVLDSSGFQLSSNSPAAVSADGAPSRSAFDLARARYEAALAQMIALQEELDWRCYQLYGLLEDAPQYPNPPPLHLGQRAFEIAMARRMAVGDLQTTWFERHRSIAITELPSHWSGDYRAVVERRIALIESDSAIGLIERPEYKRRWSAPSWEDMERDALRAWLLDRLEVPPLWSAEDPRIISSQALADAVRHDGDFVAVAELYAGREGFDLDALVAELVTRECVPFLAALRYTESGLRKRADWEATWERQRAEDAIDAGLDTCRDEFLRAAWTRIYPRKKEETGEDYTARMNAGLGVEEAQKAADVAIATEAKRRKQVEVGDIPVPPKYKTPDFQSQDIWRLRGGLDVPKERFVSFPHCASHADSSLPILWAGYDHLARARAIAAWYVERKDSGGWPAARLKPLLAGLLELVPWLRQWHNDIDTETGLRMGEFFLGYVEEQARELGLTLDDLRGWTPPATPRRGRGQRTAA